MNRPISVAIATYNRAHILPETLGYVLGQTVPPAEVVVVDDGSSDATAQVVAELQAAGAPLRYLRIDNAGPGVALKTAIEACTHEWIAMCDDDDQWLPDHLARRQQLLDAHPDVDYTFSNFTSFGPGALEGFDEFKNIPEDWWPTPAALHGADFQRLGTDQFANFLRYNPVFPTSVCMRRALYERMGGIDPQFSRLGCWDAHFTWRCVLHGTVACDKRITVATRKHVQNFSRKRSQVNLQRADMLRTAWRDGWIPREHQQAVDQAVEETHLRAARWAWAERDFKLLREALAGVVPARIPAGLRLRGMLAGLAVAVGVGSAR